MEGPRKETILSAEQQEQKEKFVRLSSIMFDFYASMMFETDSNVSYEGRTSITDFKLKCKKEGLKLENYLLGRIFFDFENKDYDPNLPFDTEDEKIEKQILKYEKTP